MSSCGVETIDVSVNRPVMMYNPVDNDNVGDQQPVRGLENDLENNREANHENNREADHENNQEDVLVINWLERLEMLERLERLEMLEMLEDLDESVLEGDPLEDVSDSKSDSDKPL